MGHFIPGGTRPTCGYQTGFRPASPAARARSAMTETMIQEIRQMPTIDPGVRIGHVHLKVADLDRALAFYCGVLGFELTQRFGSQAAFLSAGGYHHHIGLNTWESEGGAPAPFGHTGLYHLAILYPTRPELAQALARVIEAK